MSPCDHPERRPVARPGLSPEAVQHVVRQLDAFDPAVIYLFGSHGEGRAGPDSDLDVAFLPGRPCEVWAVFLTAQELAARLGREVDLLDLRQASTVMRKEVLRTGYRLACRRPIQADEFEMYTLSDYARLNEERAPVLKSFVPSRLLHG